jgi:hypothetical protein
MEPQRVSLVQGDGGEELEVELLCPLGRQPCQDVDERGAVRIRYGRAAMVLRRGRPLFEVDVWTHLECIEDRLEREALQRARAIVQSRQWCQDPRQGLDCVYECWID